MGLLPGSSAVERSTVNRMVACSNQARGAIFQPSENDEAAGMRAARPLRRGVFVSAIGTTPHVHQPDLMASAPEAIRSCSKLGQEAWVLGSFRRLREVGDVA